MKKMRSSNENEMIYEFLRMEVSSDRYSEEILEILEDLHVTKDVIIDGNLSDKQENILRTEILGRFRGFKKNKDLFENFPTQINWVWTIFERADILKIIYINYSYLLE